MPTAWSTALADRYRIDRELGAGGMATVYLAEDLRHHRKVALKVLRPELAAVIGAERFLHEITTTANLQHPHILPLHDSGSLEGTAFYVMPYVEGESLRDRLTRETQLPIADAVRIAREVASALDYAHRRGVIHRDIKPENILLHDGRALVADFGIALAASSAGGSRMTETGMSLGTPTYMSPEQAMGERTLDARADIYALGCVLYEMLTGEPPFAGPTAQAIVARVMTAQPTPPLEVRNTVPAHVNETVLTALQKLPADRFATAGAFAEALERPGFTGPMSASAARAGAALPAPSRGLVYALAGVTVLALALAAWAWFRPGPTARVSRYAVQFASRFGESEDAPSVSPDGRRFVYSTSSSTLGLHDESRLTPTNIPGAELGWAPFFAPDGGSIGFFTGFPGDLKVANLATGSVVTLIRDSAQAYGGTWSDDGWLYHTADFGRALMRVRPGGGPAELVLRADSTRNENFFRWPHALPRGRGLLLTIWRPRGLPDVAFLDLRRGTTTVLMPGLRGWYTPSGHLVVVRGDGAVAAARFSPGGGVMRGQAVEVFGTVTVRSGGTPLVALGADGTLLYVPESRRTSIVRVSRAGVATVVDPAMGAILQHVAVSPDGTRLAVSRQAEGRIETWIKVLDTGPFFRVAAHGAIARRPFWSPDGRSVGFVSDYSGETALYRTAADGSGAVERLLRFGRPVDEGTWSRDGAWLVMRAGSGSGRDVLGMRPGGDSVPMPLAATEAEEYSPTVSTDGRWLAYGSDASGRDEIFVRPFPSAGESRIQVSVAGGTEPLWSRSGRELFYRDEAGDLVSVLIAPGPEFRVVSRQVLFSTRGYTQDTRHRTYDVSPDDRSFYFIVSDAGPTDQIVLVRNWFEELKAALRP